MERTMPYTRWEIAAIVAFLLFLVAAIAYGDPTGTSLH
jgi:hypothetical protein